MIIYYTLLDGEGDLVSSDTSSSLHHLSGNGSINIAGFGLHQMRPMRSTITSVQVLIVFWVMGKSCLLFQSILRHPIFCLYPPMEGTHV